MSQGSSRWGCFSVFIVLVLLVSLILNTIFYFSLKSKKHTSRQVSATPFDEEVIVAGNGDARIAVIDLLGVISYGTPGMVDQSMVDDVLLQLRQASSDPSVKGIIFRIDSPGGEVNASDVLYNALRKFRDQSKKPVVGFIMSVGASGGYYAAMGSSWLIANEMTLTGSIGVIMQAVQYDGLMGKVGVKVNTFKSGRLKDLLSGDRPPTEEEMALVQGLVMESYDRFVGIVSAERFIPLDRLKNGIADGRILSGPQALEAKLVDQLGYFEDAITKARELAKSPEAEVVRYVAPFDLGRMFSLMGSGFVHPPKVEFNLLPKGLMLEPGKPYFLSSHLFYQGARDSSR
jgi:protease-4